MLLLTAPHQPRLDSQMWFAARGRYDQNPWFLNFIFRLMKNEREGWWLCKTTIHLNEKLEGSAFTFISYEWEYILLYSRLCLSSSQFCNSVSRMKFDPWDFSYHRPLVTSDHLFQRQRYGLKEVPIHPCHISYRYSLGIVNILYLFHLAIIFLFRCCHCSFRAFGW